MGNRGHVEKQERAREMRSEAATLREICDELGCSKSSASKWTQGVEFTPKPRSRGIGVTKPHPLHLKKLAEIEECRQWAATVVGDMSDRDLLMAGIGLYAGDGAKTGTAVKFSNSNPALVELFMRWMRECFDASNPKFRGRLYLHEGLDLEAATAAWVATTGIPASQFGRPYRAKPDVSIRHNKHEYGCLHVVYHSARTFRKILGLMQALVS